MKNILMALMLLCFEMVSAQSYHIGDLYTAPDGSRGIVYYVHPDGSGGWVVALDDASTGCAWGDTTDVPELTNYVWSSEDYSGYVMMYHDTAGYANTLTIRSYHNNSNYAAMLVDFAHGWVLPSSAQLNMLYGQLPFISSSIVGAGGTDLALACYWTSVEYNDTRAYAFEFGTGNSGRSTSAYKTSLYRVRAVRSFSYPATITYDTSLTYQWNTGSTQQYVNINPSQTTNYQVTVTTEFGCSNTAEQTIIVGTGSSQTIYDTTCRGAGYEANGFTLTAEETSTPGLLNRTRTLETEGCSSTLTLQLLVRDTASTAVNQTACGSYTWNGVTYYESGSYSQTFTAANGCDSVVTLHLTIKNCTDVLSVDTVIVCDSYVWNDSVYTVSGDYTKTFVMANGCDSVVTLHLTIIPLPELSHTPDTVIIAGTSANLWASGTDVLYWTDSSGNILASGSSLMVSPQTSTLYYLTGQNYSAAVGNNLVVNGDFEQGNVGFTSEYNYVQSTTVLYEGYYSVGPNAHNFHPGFYNWPDHTTGMGNYMIVNGAESPNTNVWTQTVSVSPHTDYAFSVWVCSVGGNPQIPTEVARLQFSVNGVQVGDIFTAPNSYGQWSHYYEVWNSGEQTSAYITILNQNTAGGGNDFGIDDISFTPLTECSVTDSVYVHVTGFPDNVDSADCTFLPEGTEWSIGEPIVSGMIASMCAAVPLVGDVDDDGQQEIVMHTDSKILIFNSNAELKNQFNMCNTRQESQLALAKVLYAQDEYKTIIVAYSSNNYFYAYDASGQLLWQSNQPFSSYNSESYKMPAISFADFNHDGWTEMFAGSEVYDAATGVFLCKTNGNKGHAGRTWESYGTYQSSAADLLGDASLELAVGNTVYAVDLQSRSDASLNQISPLKTISSANMVMEEGSVIPFTDGNTFLLDINLDGQLDVLVMNEEQSGRVIYLYVWDVVSQSILCSKRIPNARKFGMPQIGDIDSDGFPEICFVVGTYPNHQHGNNETVFALKYNEQSPTGEMDVFWTTPHSDYSGATSLTLFDFNQDGYSELVYRDENHLRIINGSMLHHQTGEAVTAPYDMASYACGSGTALEYPIVCDVDQDGAAEIIIASSCNSSSHVGHLYIFKSAGVPWAPARKVWNQYMYNVTNVNEDLTIPQYLFNNATAFTDPQGTVRRPFNNFLQQGTTIDQYGRPFYAVPDVAVNQTASVQVNGDSLLLSFSYCNLGDNTFNAPYSITVFANAYGGDTVCTVTMNESLPVDGCTNGKIRVPVGALCAAQAFDSLVIAVNCAGAGIAQNGNLQPECDTTNNSVAIAFSLHTDTTHVTETACDTFDWYEHVGITQNGDYTHVFTNAAGCDSTVIMHLTVLQSTHNVLDNTVCESYTWTEGDGATYTVTGTYTYDYTNAEGCASTDTLHLTIIPLPELSHTLDTVIIAGTSADLWAAGADVLTWANGDGEQLASGMTLTVSPETSTTYFIHSFNEGSNMVYNGDFEDGNVGFSTDYAYGSTGSHDHYYVGYDIANMWPWDSPGFPVTDHTSGSGQFLMIDGSIRPNTTVWSQTILVEPNTDYLFSAWFLTDNIAYFKYEINGVQTGIDYSTPDTRWVWKRYSQVWNSGSDTVAEVKIINRFSQSGGYDYCIDDISFTPLTACSVTDSIQVHVTGYPDNVDSADCTVFSTGHDWGIIQDWASTEMVSPLVIPLVGDIDGDEVPEIICFAPNNSYTYYGSTQAMVFNTLTHQLVHTINLPDRISTIDAAPYGIIKLPNGHVILVVALLNYTMHAYDLTLLATSPIWSVNTDYYGPNVSFADFNSDSYPEICIGNKIYDAETGNLLISSTAITNTASSLSHNGDTPLPSPCVANVVGDYRPDLILGNEIYEVLITNRYGLEGNSITLSQSITPPAGVSVDGHPQVADFNLDGHLDVFVSNKSSQYASVGCYVWDVYNNTVSTPLVIPTTNHGKSIPLIADVDNDDTLEIVVQCRASSGNKVKCYKYSAVTAGFDFIWDIYVDEDSYSNSMSVFDFNNDGQNDLLISDQTTVRIVNGSGHSHLSGNDTIPVYVLTSLSFGECTVMQYPVVADVDADGSAELVVLGRFGSGHTYKAYLNIFRSASIPWAPARKVWNQYMYNVTNVNEDLTIPQYLFNNATAFTDPEGVVRRPFNNFLQQGTTIDQYGRPFYAVPDVAVNQTASVQANGDSLLMSFSYCNIGDNTLNAPYTITVFANAYGGDTVCTVTMNESLPVDSCANGKIRVPVGALCAAQAFDSLVIAVNCAGAGIAQNGHLQPECDTTNNMVTIAFSSHIDTTHVTETACDTFDWYEHVGVTQSGDYTHVFTNAIGCDSTVIMHLTVSQSTHNVLDNTVCESYTWTEGDGETYTTSGLYTYDYTNAEGCASTDTLHLTIIPMPELSHTPDTVILTGTSVTLWSTGADVLYWSDASGNILASSPTLTVSPVTSTRYYLVGQNQGDCSVTDTIHVVVTGYPDNVDSADCVFFPEGTEWGIGQPLVSSASAITVTTPMVGDIDDDGQQEVVCPAGNSSVVSRINIFNADATLKSYFNTVGFYMWNSVGLAKVKWQENEYKNIIVVLGTDKRLHAYDAQGTQLWQSNVTFGTQYNESTPLPSISFTDFNHDGWTEIYIGADIYDAATGVLLSRASGNKGYSGRTWSTQNNVYHTVVADFFGDCDLELVAGNTIYSVDIQSRTDFNANQMSVVREVPPAAMKMEDNSSIPFTDGNTYLADMNLDGRLDVLVMNVDQSSRVVYLYVWDVETQSIICSKKIANARKFGTPQIGDINQDGYDEVCFITGTYSDHSTGNNDLIYALQYNPQNSNGELDVFWTTSHSDNSACTGLTLFDFNQDGIAELVYRDRFNLRIINGSLIHHQTGEAVTQPYDIAVSPCGSATGIEYPLVVDVDLDGEAEIVVGGATYETDFGHLYIFNSSGEPWAPARKVWNQYMYNVTNVNEDLTIPQYLFNNATAFTDPEGVVRWPFNNFLQQGTTIDQYGRPLYAVPDVVVEPFASSQMIGDSLLLTFSYCNLGDNPLNAPYSITVFANAYGGDMVCTVTVNESLSVDSCMNGKIRVPVGALCAAQPFDTLVIAVNCAGAGIAQNDNLQPECDTTNNMVTLAFSLHIDTTHVIETACDTFDWYEYEGVTQSGDYTHVFTNATGCDSTVIMHLTVFQSTHNVLDTIVCETYTWTEGTGETYTVSDTYTHAYTNDNGCASTDTLHLIILHGTNHVLDTTVCESFTWTEGTGETYTVSDTYTHAYTNADRCASVDTLHLTILHGTHHVLDTTVCESFTWTEGTGETYTVSDTYTYAYTNDDGCASVDTLYLTILHGTHHVLDTTVCERFTWTEGTGETYTVSDTYTHSYINDDGCASTDTLHLIILHGTNHVLDTTVCESFTWTEGTGETYTVSDTYTHAYINADGCASVDTLHLTILHGTHHVLDTTVCESFTWTEGTGETYTVSDTYTYAYVNDDGCASTDTLHLTILHGTHHVLDTTVCESFTWTAGTGETYTVSDTYTHSYINDDGCASTDTLHLMILHGTHHVLDTTVCESFTWTEGTGEIYTVSDTYTHAYINVDGCASTDTLHLTILHGTHHVLDTTVCESFTWIAGTGETYTVSDTYTYAYINDDGCASTDTLHLTILHGTHHVLDTTVCERFTWTEGTGETYTVSDTYTHAYTNSDGCVSMDTLHLTILHGTHNVLDTTVCESFTWTEGSGETYTVSDTYTHSYTNIDGCASVDTLHLTILHGTHNVLDTTVCESFTWTEGSGETYTVSDTYTHSYTNIDGCASVDTLHLTILHGTHHVLDTTVCESFTWMDGTGETYTVSDTYTHAYTNDDGCASTDTLHLTILHGTHHVLDTTVCESFTWTAGTGETYTVSDTYTHSYINDDGCASTDTLHLTVRPLPVAIINGPSHLCEDSSIVLSSNSAASYQWNTGETTQSIVVHEEGTYTLVVTDEFGCSGDTSLRVSASYNPILNVNIPDMCAGGSYTISVGYQNENNVQLGHGSTTLSMVDTVFLPDGVPCEPHGCSYRSPLTFSAYGRNEVVESVEDIYYVRLNMEHSWAGDIYINITCPNGQKADIMKYGGSGISTCNSSIVPASRGWQSGSNADVGSYFGQAYDMENGSDICNPDAVGNEQGVGWNYCWSNNNTQGYVYAPGDGGLVYRSENEHYGILDSSNVVAGTHFYHPDQSFSSLIGCPLNGSWYIEVIDGWDVDNGYIFGWELALRNEVLSAEEAVFTGATSDGPWMTSLNDSLFRLDPPADLTQDTAISYTFHIFDDFGCQYDTTVEVLFFVPRHTIIDTVSCDAVVWNGVQYAVSGSYSDTLTSLQGCDSIVTLNLTINQCYIEENVDTMVCVSAMPYTWHGHLFAQAGEWIDTVDRNDGFFLVTTYQLSVSNPAVTEMGTSQITCFGGSDGQVQVLVSGGVQPYSYHWENAAGTTVATTAQLSNRPAGTYTLYVSDAIGCTTTQTVNLTHLSDSMMAGTIPQTRLVCMGNTLPLVTGTAASGGASSAYQWQFSTNGVNWNAAPTPNNSQNYNYPNAVTSSFFLRRAWVSQACGTVYSNVMSVTVSPLYADTLHDMVCQGYSYQNYGFNISETETAESTFIARTRQLQSSQGCDSSVTLLLTVIAPQHTTIADGTCQHSSYQANGFDIASEQLATAGEYTFEQQYVVNNCDSVVTLHLTVYPEYEVNLQAVVCEGDGYHQHGFNIPAVQTIGIDEVEVSQNLQSQHNCDSVVNLHLTVVDTSIAIVSLKEDFCEEYSADLSVETNATNYVWSTGETTPVITVNQPGLYTVTATQDNCIISAQYQIQKCEFNVYLPNAITPGLGDGINDYFCIHDHYKAMIEDFEIRIYSRWGELVYYSDDKDFKWNGEIKGRIIRQVIYTYLINFTDKRGIPHQLTGNITVL